MTPPPEFLTQRLRLRPFKPDDLEHLEAYVLREHFWRYLPLEPPTPHSVRRFLEDRLADSWGEGGYCCAVELCAVGHLIGTARISVTSAAHGSGDMGYALNDDFSGQGYATEAVKRLLQVGFADLGLHRVWATADVENAPSWRVMERVGMQREGLLRQDKLIRGTRRDSYLYAKLASEG